MPREGVKVEQRKVQAISIELNMCGACTVLTVQVCAVSPDCKKRARAGRSNSCSPGVTGISQLQELSYFMAAVTMCVTRSPAAFQCSCRYGSGFKLSGGKRL